MKLELNTDICPIININTYGGTFSVSDRSEGLDYEVDESKGLSNEEKEYYSDHCTDFDFDRYMNDLARMGIKYIWSFFDDIKHIVKVKLNEDYIKVYSPRYYNFETDYMYFEIDIEESEIEKIKNNVLEISDEFFTWAEKYKSRDGFISYMPHYKDEWIKAIDGKDIERAIAMYFTYILESNEDMWVDDWMTIYQENFVEYVFGNSSIEEYMEDERCLQILDKVCA